jgi:phage baseplate assembly protein W|tara:strand:- start:3679 stop:4881 length:1203 start_codon:yes stop_codon:yes gene_type:complete
MAAPLWTVNDNDIFTSIKSEQTINVNLPIQTENATNDLEEFLNNHRTPSSTIYVDMDNTIAGFNIRLAQLYGVDNLLNADTTTTSIATQITNNSPGFFQNLSVLPQAINNANGKGLLDLVKSIHGSYSILTTDTSSTTLNNEKISWVNSNLSTFPPTGSVNFATGFNKGPYGNSNTILIDDTPSYIAQFKAAGGQAFRYIYTTLESGSLPDGLSLVNNRIEGTAPSVSTDTTYTFTIRLHYNSGYVDRILKISIVASINRSMAYDSARISSERQSRTWKDLNLNFSKNPVTGDITKLSGTESVKRSVRNLIQTNHYEKPFHPEIGSGIRDLLFEPATPLTEIFLAKKIEETLVNFEPRVRLIAVNVNAQPDENSYRVWIEFYVVNHPTPVIIDTFLERLR